MAAAEAGEWPGAPGLAAGPPAGPAGPVEPPRPATSSQGRRKAAKDKVRKPYTITKQRERWSDEEHGRFLEALKLYGRAWRRIEEHIGTKTAVQIRSHAQKFFSKLEKEQAAGAKPDGCSDMDIPPPRPKRKPSHPYPRKASEIAAGDPALSTELPDFTYLSNPSSEAAVAAVAAAASAAAAAAAAAVIAAAGEQVQAQLQAHPPQGFPFWGFTPSMLAQLHGHCADGKGLGFAGQSAGFGSPQLCSPSTGKLAAAGAHHMGDGASAAAAQHRGASAPLGGWHRATCYERTATSEQKECEDAPGTTQGCTRSSDGDSACSREQGAGCMGAPAASSGRRKDSGATSHVRKASPSYGSFARPPWSHGPVQRSGGCDSAALGPHAWNAMVEAATAAASQWGIPRPVPSLAAEQGSARPMGRTGSLSAGGAGEGGVQAAHRNECGVKRSHSSMDAAGKRGGLSKKSAADDNKNGLVARSNLVNGTSCAVSPFAMASEAVKAGRADGSDSSAVSNLAHEDKVMNYGCTADTNVHVEYNRATQDGEASGEGSGSNPTGNGSIGDGGNSGSGSGSGNGASHKYVTQSIVRSKVGYKAYGHCPAAGSGILAQDIRASAPVVGEQRLAAGGSGKGEVLGNLGRRRSTHCTEPESARIIKQEASAPLDTKRVLESDKGSEAGEAQGSPTNGPCVSSKQGSDDASTSLELRPPGAWVQGWTQDASGQRPHLAQDCPGNGAGGFVPTSGAGGPTGTTHVALAASAMQQVGLAPFLLPGALNPQLTQQREQEQAMLSWGLQTPFEALFSAYASQSGLGPRLPPPPPPVLRLRAAIGGDLLRMDAASAEDSAKQQAVLAASTLNGLSCEAGARGFKPYQMHAMMAKAGAPRLPHIASTGGAPPLAG